MTNVPLGPGAEFDRIRAMVVALGERGILIGDDAAVLDIPAGKKLVVSTDTSVEEVHFRREWLSFEEMGYRATAAALSDLAAMAASPLGVVLAVSIDGGDTEHLENLARGAGAAARDSGTVVIGGDLSRSKVFSLGVTVLGAAEKPLSRAGARAGDQVYVTGLLGGARLALEALQRGGVPGVDARKKFARPVPRISEAIWLCAQGASACIDISDGITGDLGHIAAASGVSLAVDIGKLPLFPGATIDLALTSGEEYELCVSSPVELDTAAFRDRFGIPLTFIGIAESSHSPAVIFHAAGEPVRAPSSFSHFRE